jgi:hypothetical protein
VYALARQAGFSVAGAVTMTAIAGAESGLRPDAIGDVNLTEPGERSVGLWQINYRPSRDRGSATRDPQANLDPATNARHAFEIAGGGKSFRPWSTYTSGAYLKHLDTARAAVGNSSPPATSGPTPNRGTTGADFNPLDPTGLLSKIPGLPDVPNPLNIPGLPDVPNPLSIPGKVVGGITDKVREIVLVGLFVLGGVALVGAGVWRGTQPAREKVGDVAAVVAAPETGGASLALKGAT